MSNIIGNYAHSFTPKDRNDIEWAFNQLGLPIPDTNEYHEGDPSPVVFLNPFGLTLRIVPKDKHPLIRHRRLLRPLIAFDAPNFRVELQPAHSICEYEGPNFDVYQELLGDDILVRDIQENYSNCMHLPLSRIGLADDFVVAYDPEEIDILSKRVKEIRKKLNDHPSIFDLRKPANRKQDYQDRLYDPVRDEFAKAVIPGQINLDRNAVVNFWSACNQAKKQKLFHPIWKRIGAADHKAVPKLARNYEKRLQQTELFADIL